MGAAMGPAASSSRRDAQRAAGDPRDVRLVTCTLGDGEYGLEIARVREIIRVGRITRLPNTPGHVEGVISLRGRILPILCLRRRLGLPEAAPTARSRVIVVEAEGRQVGLLVDAVSRVVQMASGDLEAPPEEAGGPDACVSAIAQRAQTVVLVLDLAVVLAAPVHREVEELTLPPHPSGQGIPEREAAGPAVRNEGGE